MNTIKEAVAALKCPNCGRPKQNGAFSGQHVCHSECACCREVLQSCAELADHFRYSCERCCRSFCANGMDKHVYTNPDDGKACYVEWLETYTGRTDVGFQELRAAYFANHRRNCSTPSQEKVRKRIRKRRDRRLRHLRRLYVGEARPLRTDQCGRGWRAYSRPTTSGTLTTTTVATVKPRPIAVVAPTPLAAGASHATSGPVLGTAVARAPVEPEAQLYQFPTPEGIVAWQARQETTQEEEQDWGGSEEDWVSEEAAGEDEQAWEEWQEDQENRDPEETGRPGSIHGALNGRFNHPGCQACQGVAFTRLCENEMPHGDVGADRFEHGAGEGGAFHDRCGECRASLVEALKKRL